MPQQITRGPAKSGDAASIRVRKRASAATPGPSETASPPIQAQSRIATQKPDKPHKPSRRRRHAPRSVNECERLIQALTDDLGEQERKEQQLRRYVGYLTVGQQITRTGSWAWSRSSGELFWSREHFRIFGLDPSRTNVSYELFFRMIHPEERARAEQEFQEAVRGRRDFEGEYRVVRPDGGIVHIHSRAYPVFGKPGEITEYVGTVADITERKHREESLGSMQAELARASRAITLGQLMASIAHEVNQPLAAVVANANAALRWLAWKGPRIEKAREALERIVRDGNRASEIIARIRGLVRRSDAQRDPLSLNSVIHEVAALLKAELQSNNITVRTNLAEPLLPIHGDRVQMQQVLINLIMNAIEAMNGVVTRPRLLTITTTADDTGVAVAVEDSGIGIDPQALERIFEPFYSNKPQGMGIGLAISRSIIEAHGGRLWAVNKAPGASFRFRLPATAGEPT
jgi:PAS domain S-box-containing protein